ncbi:MAG: helix-turn-helix domain-containing protein [Ruminococcus flavefaciens]|jgi:DNA-binding LacI/PurR family transcriptional regulator/GGDEF domain-containing protein|nr:helix-turn-helix domain-containing protein [Ruminococcus flavefaciens]
MNYSKSPIIAVVTAAANGFAEKELLRGIITENRNNGYATVVLSNIYNIVNEGDDLLCEHRIYELLGSSDISGVILLCESFVESDTRRRIAAILEGKRIPIVGIGTRLEEFERIDYDLINTSDIEDIEELTDHLIEHHSFTDIAFLSGMKEIETSRLRVEGYLKALRSHGIEPDMNKVYYGDFWYNSGEKLAGRYVRGEIPMPQAVICANDVMAYGMLRCFAENNINVPQQITVVSYEYTDTRLYYYPLLTSYHRNREDLGKAAANRLRAVIEGEPIPEYKAPRGEIIFGSSCSCSIDKEQSLSELKLAESKKNYNDLNLFSTMEQKLILCRDMEEFVHIIGDFQWLIQNKKNIYLCLYSDWHDTKSEGSDIMFSRSIFHWDGSKAFEMHHHDLHTFFEMNSSAEVCYFTPLFSGQRLFGYMTILYDTPESYDDIYRHWLKSVSIGLEFLRLKNDIRYLLSCQNVSEYRDTLTGMSNEKGIRRAFQAVNVHGSKRLYFVMLRTDLFPRRFSEEEISQKTEAILGTAKAISKFCGNHDISGRIGSDEFVCLVQSMADADMIADLLSAVLIQERAYTDYAGVTSFVCCAVPCKDASFDELLQSANEICEQKHLELAAQRKNKLFGEMSLIRNSIYASVESTFESDRDNTSIEKIDAFRRNYKSCFGVTFHQDCINARIAKAKYYLATTSVSIAEISEKCGYIDHKYFQRQFTQNTGIPALKYRNLIKM